MCQWYQPISAVFLRFLVRVLTLRKRALTFLLYVLYNFHVPIHKLKIFKLLDFIAKYNFHPH